MILVNVNQSLSIRHTLFELSKRLCLCYHLNEACHNVKCLQKFVQCILYTCIALKHYTLKASPCLTFIHSDFLS